MPLTRPGLTLVPTPRAAADARRWVASLCRELDRTELVECAELGVSELVTNALLHGEPPVSVRVRGTRNHPRIEVRDASSRPPQPPEPALSDDDFLATFGRGLSIVAMAAVAWGAALERDGKVVWFEPAIEITGEAVSGLIETLASTATDLGVEGNVEISLIGLDVDLYASLENQYHELRRELRLLSLAHEESYPLAGDLSTTFAGFERLFPTQTLTTSSLRHRAAGSGHVDVSVPMRPGAAPIFTTMLEMFDLADAFCRAERLLALQRTPAQREFHQWLLGEFIRQLGGAAPRRWQPANDGAGSRVS